MLLNIGSNLEVVCNYHIFLQIFASGSGSFKNNLRKWSRSMSNLCDGSAIVLFYVGLILRLNQSTLTAGRVVLAIDIMFWIVRLLEIFSVDRNLGSYVVIIGKMVSIEIFV